MRKVLSSALLAACLAQTGQAPSHTAHPAAQWFPDAALFVLPKFKGNSPYEKDTVPAADETLALAGVGRPASVTLLRDGSAVPFTFDNSTVTVRLPASTRTKLVDVVKIELSSR